MITMNLKCVGLELIDPLEIEILLVYWVLDISSCYHRTRSVY